MLKYIIIVVVGLVVCLVVGYILLMYTNMNKLKKKKLAYPLEENNQIRVTKDIVYKTVEDKNLLMDVYAPANAVSGEKRVVIFVHGEGLEVFIKDAKDWGIYTSYGKLLASKGFIAITFNHRYASKNFTRIKEITEEIKAAVVQVQKNSKEWNADVDNMFVWSFSLGGIYSSIFLRNDYHVKAVISYYGLLDSSTRIPPKLQKDFEEYTPDQYLRNIGNTKIMIVKAAKDKVAGVNQSIDNFIKAAEKYKIEYNYLIHTGGHSLDVLTENEETKEIIDQTIGFIENISRNK